MSQHVHVRYAHRGIALTEDERRRLIALEDWHPALVQAMLRHGNKLHQELWVSDLYSIHK